MTHSTIQILFYTALVFGLGGGAFVMYWWGKKIWKKYYKSATSGNLISISGVSMKAFIYMFPGILLFFLMNIPLLYMASLLKKEDYCKEIIKFNKGIKKDDPFIKERCDCLDVDELFENALKEEN
jgi:hypothetical protein